MLTEARVRNAKAQDKGYRISDGDGLHLFVTTAGGKSWRFRYFFGGKERILVLGSYPDTSIAEARRARDEARALLNGGRDPSVERKRHNLVAAVNAGTTFRLLAKEWYDLQKPQWVERHALDVWGSLENDIFPDLGDVPIREITPPMVLSALRKIEARPAIETARRARQRISAVCVYAIASGRAENDPAAIVKGALAPLRKGRQPAVLTLAAAREVVRAVEGTPSSPVTKLAHRLLALTVVRPGVITTVPWEELVGIEEQEEPVWTIPSERMKLRLHFKGDEARDHLVPLSRQAVETIAAIRTLSGRGPLVFPNGRHAHRPMSENAIGYLLNRAGYHHHHVPHGWRATFSTTMNERHPEDRQVIDMVLAHTMKDKVEEAYNRARHLKRRRDVLQEWADLLLEGMPPAAALLGGARR